MSNFQTFQTFRKFKISKIHNFAQSLKHCCAQAAQLLYSLNSRLKEMDIASISESITFEEREGMSRLHVTTDGAVFTEVRHLHDHFQRRGFVGRGRKLFDWTATWFRSIIAGGVPAIMCFQGKRAPGKLDRSVCEIYAFLALLQCHLYQNQICEDIG